LHANRTCMLGSDIAVRIDTSRTCTLRRYDALSILAIDTNGYASFQKIDKDDSAGNYGRRITNPLYRAPIDSLRAHLRPQAEPVAAAIEGLALVKPFEQILRHGRVCIDVPAWRQYRDTLPIVRRVRLGSINVVGSYDPSVVYGRQPRQITLGNFDGIPGLNVAIPCDAQMRIFVLRTH
jgi:hypothetical protein